MEIGIRPNGLEPALEILFFRLFGDREAKRAHEPEVIEAGRELIGKLEFDVISDHDDHNLELVAESCLSGTAGASTAHIVCERFKRFVLERPFDLDNYHNFLAGLCRVQPLMVLDLCFTVTTEKHEIVADKLALSASYLRNPFDSIPCNTLIEWCEREPQSRYARMARVVPFLKSTEREDINLQWSDVALGLIEHAPNPAAVLSNFVKRFGPSSWIGSLASILEGRKTLLAELVGHKNLVVATAAEEALRLFTIDVDAERKREADRDRQRDEQFE